jgi:hypothetical protein
MLAFIMLIFIISSTHARPLQLFEKRANKRLLSRKELSPEELKAFATKIQEMFQLAPPKHVYLLAESQRTDTGAERKYSTLNFTFKMCLFSRSLES